MFALVLSRKHIMVLIWILWEEYVSIITLYISEEEVIKGRPILFMTWYISLRKFRIALRSRILKI